ncbi:hypothetical protein PR048_033455 [Dryococelus australis]|uniref:Uncharacterized protein n=1 Tax=Dryococelus australis TaxID=614101 RepID=A0ABQ9G3F2_9NEOP|nr:hypothetical protein PR048_033455 [Dryococelus australis]
MKTVPQRGCVKLHKQLPFPKSQDDAKTFRLYRFALTDEHIRTRITATDVLAPRPVRSPDLFRTARSGPSSMAPALAVASSWLIIRSHFPSRPCTGIFATGTTVDERLACSPPTKAIRAQSPAGSLRIFAYGNRAGRDAVFRRVFFVGDLPFPPAISFRRCSILTSVTLIGSQYLAVKSRPNLFTLPPLSSHLFQRPHPSTGRQATNQDRSRERRRRAKAPETPRAVATSNIAKGNNSNRDGCRFRSRASELIDLSRKGRARAAKTGRSPLSFTIRPGLRGWAKPYTEIRKHGSYKGHTGTRYNSAIATTRRALNWHAVFSSSVLSIRNRRSPHVCPGRFYCPERVRFAFPGADYPRNIRPDPYLRTLCGTGAHDIECLGICSWLVELKRLVENGRGSLLFFNLVPAVTREVFGRIWEPFSLLVFRHIVTALRIWMKFGTRCRGGTDIFLLRVLLGVGSTRVVLARHSGGAGIVRGRAGTCGVRLPRPHTRHEGGGGGSVRARDTHARAAGVRECEDLEILGVQRPAGWTLHSYVRIRRYQLHIGCLLSQRKATIGPAFPRRYQTSCDGLNRIILEIDFHSNSLVWNRSMRVKRGEYGAAPKCKGWEKRDIPEKTRRTVGIVRQDSHVRKSGSDPAGYRTRRCCAQRGWERSLRSGWMLSRGGRSAAGMSNTAVLSCQVSQEHRENENELTGPGVSTALVRNTKLTPQARCHSFVHLTRFYIWIPDMPLAEFEPISNLLENKDRIPYYQNWSITVSTLASHQGEPGSIPGNGIRGYTLQKLSFIEVLERKLPKIGIKKFVLLVKYDCNNFIYRHSVHPTNISGNRARRCRWSAGFSRGSPVSPASSIPALHHIDFIIISLLRTAQNSSLFIINKRQDVILTSLPSAGTQGRGKRQNPEKTRIFRHDSDVRKSTSDPARESNPVTLRKSTRWDVHPVTYQRALDWKTVNSALPWLAAGQYVPETIVTRYCPALSRWTHLNPPHRRFRWVWRRRKNVLVRLAGASALRDASRELGKILDTIYTAATQRPAVFDGGRLAKCARVKKGRRRLEIAGRRRLKYNRYTQHDENTARLADRSDRALDVHVNIDLMAPALNTQNQYKLDFQHLYTEVSFAIGSQFIRHTLDNSEPIADLQGNNSATLVADDQPMMNVVENSMHAQCGVDQ